MFRPRQAEGPRQRKTIRKDYDRIKERARAAASAKSRAGRDIGPIPPVAHPRRKALARTNFARFCKSYLPKVFHLPWSPDHKIVLARLEQAALKGGLFAVAMPRGSGKTSLVIAACLWTTLYGHREFVALIGSDENAATKLLDSIKMQIEKNPRIAEDFPEVAFPVGRLDGIHNRAPGQLCEGQRTYISWTGSTIVYPTVPNSPAAGAILTVAGLTGSIRGMLHTRPDGRQVRPSLVIIDDPQTDQSARSPSQCATRLSILSGAILGLAGPGTKIAGIMPCTVIRRGDVADTLLDPDQHPEWNGHRGKLLYAMPRNLDLWDQYDALRRQSMREHHDIRLATAFYKKHRRRMDAGAKPAWPQRYNEDEISAVQHAMNLYFRDPEAFAAEYQNEPADEIDTSRAIPPDVLAGRHSGRPRGTAPIDAHTVTAAIDCHDTILYYLLIAWTDAGATILDYGTHPRQTKRRFTPANATPTLFDLAKTTSKEAALLRGLEDLLDRIARADVRREDGLQVPVSLTLVDAGYLPDVVADAIIRAGLVRGAVPSRGRGIGAKNRPIAEWNYKRGDRRGDHWGLFRRASQPIRTLEYDTNFWKSRLRDMLTVPVGSPRALTVFGSRRDTHSHLAEHLASETPTLVEAGGNRKEEWTLIPSRQNHWLDCCVMALVAGSAAGALAPAAGNAKPAKPPTRPPRKRKVAAKPL